MFLNYYHIFITINIVLNEEEADDIIHIPNINKHVNTQHEIPILQEDTTNTTINAFKNALLSTVDKLYETIDFLKNELEETNLLVKALIFREANDGNRIDEECLHSVLSGEIETTLNSTANITSHTKQI